MTSLRVLHLDHTQARGGAEYALLRVLKQATWAATLGLPKADVDAFSVYAPLEDGFSEVHVVTIGPKQLSGASSSRSVLRIAKYAASALGQAWSVRRSVFFRTADLLHTNTSRAAVYAAIAGVGTRKPLVVHLRDLVDKESLGAVGYLLFTRVALARASGVVANSNSTLESALPYLPSRTARVVIPSAAGITSTVRTSPVNDEVKRIGMVARLDPWKGQDLLLRAFAEVYRDESVQLLLAGDAAFGHEDYLLTLKMLARELRIEEQVQFLGHVEHVDEFIDTLDVCVQASVRPEPLGQNILQYLSAGKTVIATSAGGPGEWIQHERSGLLFELGDIDSLAESLRRVKDPALRSRLQQGARETPGLLTDEEVAELHRVFFEQVARG
jgi:glycosyltransferase involved in cell wall biosynthesis